MYTYDMYIYTHYIYDMYIHTIYMTCTHYIDVYAHMHNLHMCMYVCI
jgi:hypothetical protein